MTCDRFRKMSVLDPMTEMTRDQRLEVMKHFMNCPGCFLKIMSLVPGVLSRSTPEELKEAWDLSGEDLRHQQSQSN